MLDRSSDLIAGGFVGIGDIWGDAVMVEMKESAQDFTREAVDGKLLNPISAIVAFDRVMEKRGDDLIFGDAG